MSNTPRTDAAKNELHSCHDAVAADFARQLEHENAKLRDALLRVTGSLGLIIKGAGADGPGHKANYDHAKQVLRDTQEELP